MSEGTNALKSLVGPVYGTVPLIHSLPLSLGMRQAMPSRDDLEKALTRHSRLCAGYEVLLAAFHELVKSTADLVELFDQIEWETEPENLIFAIEYAKHALQQAGRDV
jgi:xanthine dehydrogenase iron-sulfur cluster and FAD-binding subunit A